MPDISKCNGDKCPIKETCYRYTSRASFMQYYGNFTYENGCNYYYKINELWELGLLEN